MFRFTEIEFECVSVVFMEKLASAETKFLVVPARWQAITQSSDNND